MEAERLYTLLANIPDVVWTTDSQGRTTFISPNVEQVYGFSADEILHASSELWLDRIHPDDVQRVRETYESLLAQGGAFDVEYRIQHRDGHWIWLHDRATVSYDRNGLRYADGVFSDITARKEAETQRDATREALRKERDFTAAVLDTAGALVVVLDLQGRIERFNRACERLTGYSFDQVKGRYLWDFSLPEEVEAVRAVFEELQAGRSPNEHENHWVAKDGSQRLIAWSNTVLFDDRGAVEYVIGTGIDVEEERRREREARVLAEIAKLVSGTLRLEEVLERTAEYARELFQANHCGIALYDAAQGTLRYVVVKGAPPGPAAELTEMEIRPTEAFRETVLEALQPMIVEDALSDSSVGPQMVPFVKQLNIQSFVVAPMEVGDRPLGFIILTTCRGRQRRFGAKDAELALAMANQAAMAIDNARLYEAEQRRAEQFRLVGEVGRRITSILDVDALLKEIACLAKEVLGYHLVGVALIEGDELVFKEGAGGVWEVPEAQIPRLKVGREGITGWVAQHGRPLLVPDVGKDPRYYAVPQTSEVRSELAVPLKSQDAIVGVLHAQSERLDAFDENDLDVLQSLAYQAAIAIENARSYASARQELAARKKAEAALQSMNEELEQRVARRTAELTEANASLRAEVAERVRAEKALRESEERYRNLFENSLNGFALHEIICDEDGKPCDYRFLEMNPAFERLTGFRADEHLGKTVRQIVDPLEPFWLDVHGRAALHGKSSHFEHYSERTDQYFEVSIFCPQRGQSAVVFQDITERKQAEEALRESEERYRTLVENNPDMIARFDREYRRVYVNPAAEKMLGAPPQDVLGKTHRELGVPAAQADRLEGFIRQVFEPRREVVFETAVPVEGEGIKHYLTRGVPEFAADGSVASALFIHRDITERVQAENELKERLEFEQLVTELSTRFVSLEANQIDVEIENAFERVGTYFGVDRIVLWELSKNKEQYQISHSWAAGGINTVRATLSTDSFPYIKKKLLIQGEPFVFSSAKRLPEEAIAERRYYDQQGIKSSLVAPLTVAGDVIGGLSLSTLYASRDWPTEAVQRLLLLGEMFANALIRKRTSQELREYELAVEGTQDLVTVVDRGHRYRLANRAFLAYHQRNRDQVVGQLVAELLGKDVFEEVVKGYLDRCFKGETIQYEMKHTYSQIGERDLLVSYFPIDGAGGIERVAVIIRDITERKRAEEALRHYADRLETLHEIDRGILAAQLPDAIAQNAVTHIRQLFPCRRVDVYTFDFQANESLLLATDLDTETELVVGQRGGPLDRWQDVIDTLRWGQVAEITLQPSRGRGSEIAYAEGVRMFYAVPLVFRGELIGTIHLAPDGPETLTPELEDTLCQVADQLAIAIQQARLNEQVQRHAEELERRVADRTRELLAMYEVMAIASQSLDLETTLDRTLARVLEAVDSDIGAIHLLDDEEETLHLATERGVPTEFIDLIRTMPTTEEVVGGWVIQHGEPLVVHDISSDPRLDARLRAAPLRYVGVPMRGGGRTLGVLGVLRDAAQPQFGEEEVTLLASLADRAGAVVESSQLRERAEQAAVLEERHRLARELHDSVTQSLYSATLMAETGQLATAAGDTDVVSNCLARLGDVTQQALKEMRLLIYELRPPELEQEGLVGALQQRLDAVEARAGTEARLLTQGEIELDASQEEALYRIALEALNNILKHASATAVTVRIIAEGQSVCLEVADDGRGFAPQAVADKGGMGLVTMRERAERVGGRLTIRSVPGEGTEVRVEVPGGTP